MEANKQDILNNIIISRYSHSGKYYSNAELFIDGYTIKIPSEEFDTLDEAVVSIKERIAEATIKFKKPSPIMGL